MARIAKRIVILALGWGFILLGIAGIFLPILQGILFLLIGLALLSMESETARRLLHKLRARFPGISAKIDVAERRAKEKWERITRRRDTIR